METSRVSGGERTAASTEWSVFGATAGGFAAALYVGLVGDSSFSVPILLLIFAIAIMRYPWRWALVTLVAGWIAELVIQARHSFSALSGSGAWLDLIRGVSLFVFVTIALALVRSRALAIERLRATQARLTAEMEQTARLAAAQERARIARDLHDVLAHSLTVVSIQIQAARQLASTDPAQATAMLDTVAGVVRESIGESRRVVSLLREPDAPAGEESQASAQLHELASQFADRTGVSCSWREQGIARPLTPPQADALGFALREGLTNAFRHGEATRVEIILAWSALAVRLTIHDNGSAGGPTPQAEHAGGGNGLRGMRERATALGGTVDAGLTAEEGFTVTLTLPFAAPAKAKP